MGNATGRRVRGVEPFETVRPEREALPAAKAPLRRLLARTFDWYLSVLAVLAILAVPEGRDPLLADKLVTFVWSVMLLLLAEPLLLRFAGATPGKALLGLRLTGMGGDRPAWFAALVRHVAMLWQGLGLGIPVLSQVRLWRSFRRCRRGEPQPWDADLTYTVRPAGAVRWAAFLLALALVTGGFAGLRQWSQLPPHRGELTVAAFAENFNRQARYAGVNFRQVLDREGRWTEPPTEDYYAAKGLQIGKLFHARWSPASPFSYTVEDGRLTAVSFSLPPPAAGSEDGAPLGQLETAVRAFVWAQRDAPVLGPARGRLLEALKARGPGYYALHQAGVLLTVEPAAQGGAVCTLALEN